MARRGEETSRIDREPPARDRGYDPAYEERRVDYERPVAVDGNGAAVASLVTGLLAATYGFLVFTAIAAILFGLIAVIFGFIGMGKARRLGGLHRGVALSGLFSGLLGLLLGIAILVGGFTLFNSPGFQQQIQEALERASEEAQD